MKRVSFKTAKALKEAGYPQEVKENEYFYSEYDSESKTFVLIPYAIEVWLWLWREKDIRIQLVKYAESAIAKESGIIYKTEDPEESIIAAIENLVDNKLLK